LSHWDWAIIALLNIPVIVYGFYLGLKVRSSADWFLAGRTLPWWLVGVSMYATAIDSSDLVGDSGETYNVGLSFFVMNWVGVVAGWIIAGFFIALPMYRRGMFTNAEYLEARFGPAARVLSVLVQLQYRTAVMAIIAYTAFLTLKIVCGLDPSAAWWGVVGIAILASIYTALGGLRSVAITDSLQFVVMLAAALIFWGLVWGEVGGWEGTREKLKAHDPEVAAEMLQVGHDTVERKAVVKFWEGADGETQPDPHQAKRLYIEGYKYNKEKKRFERRSPVWLVILAFTILGIGYSVVNHTQCMRLLGARSEWHLKMSVWAAGLILVVMSFFNLSMGVMGRALHPVVDLLPGGKNDAIYPFLVSELAPEFLKGVVVAGILAAALSTFDSIGSTLSALFTRDIYARFIVRDGDDDHYLKVGRWVTPLVIGGSFLYIFPRDFLSEGMVSFFLSISSVFVVPLLTLYLMGRFTPVHRRSGVIGLCAGGAYGLARLWIDSHHIYLSYFLTNKYAAYSYSMLITAASMVLASLVFGWEKKGELRAVEVDGWLGRSQAEARALQDLEVGQAGDGGIGKTEIVPSATSTSLLPAVLAALVLALGCILSFVVFW